MIRLEEFIKKIRECKTIAEERAEYQKEMAAIRESFGKKEVNLATRNMTKLLFINMSGQETNFGQMECLNLITSNTVIEKRIGYLGLTQLFHEQSELLMMATNRIRVDLTSANAQIVGLVLAVVSEICTVGMSKELHAEVLKCASHSSSSIRKKAILTLIKIIKKSPEYIVQFLPKISEGLGEQNHGVLLSVISFLENVILLDEGCPHREDLVALVPKVARVYQKIAHQHSAEYEIGGVQDPFLQVAILRFLKYLRKHSNRFDKDLAQVLITSHDTVCSRISENLKNGANAVLLQCFQCFMLLDPTPQFREMVSNVLSKFISVKDANSKYLSLFNLSLMAKYGIEVAKAHKNTIIECLSENDQLIRVMALDLLYIIAFPDNASSIIKQLLNSLLTAIDEDFIKELSLKICLIVEKHSQNRRWHFDTILKVLILADQSVKEESAKSLIHLVSGTPELQQYCLSKLFYATNQNPQSHTLCHITLYLLGEFAEMLPRISQLNISETVILDLIQNLIFRPGVHPSTIAYGLTTLVKLYDKFGDRQRIQKMLNAFKAHSDLEVQKRACQYIKLLEPTWDVERKKEVCQPIPVFKLAFDSFRGVPIGNTALDVNPGSAKVLEKIIVNYEDSQVPPHGSQQNGRGTEGKWAEKQTLKPIPTQQKSPLLDPFDLLDSSPAPKTSLPTPPVAVPSHQSQGLLEDIFFSGPTTSKPPHIVQPPPQSSLGFDMGFSIMSTHPIKPGDQPYQKSISLVKDDFGILGLGSGSPPQPTITSLPTLFQPQTQSHPVPQSPNNAFGLDFLGMGVASTPPQQSAGMQIGMGGQTGFGLGTAGLPGSTGMKFKACENEHLEVWIDCVKESVDITKLMITYTNKTGMQIENLSTQYAGTKNLKLTASPILSSSLSPHSNGCAQTLSVINSAVGQKTILLRIKLAYTINLQKFNWEQKIGNLPGGL